MDTEVDACEVDGSGVDACEVHACDAAGEVADGCAPLEGARGHPRGAEGARAPGAPGALGAAQGARRVYGAGCGVDLVGKKFGGAQVHVCDSFPLPKEALLPIFQVMAATDGQYESLQRFFASTLPPGFPVKFSLPVLPAISALVTFDRCELVTPDAALFEIPAEYREGGFKNFLQRNNIS